MEAELEQKIWVYPCHMLNVHYEQRSRNESNSESGKETASYIHTDGEESNVETLDMYVMYRNSYVLYICGNDAFVCRDVRRNIYKQICQLLVFLSNKSHDRQTKIEFEYEGQYMYRYRYLSDVETEGWVVGYFLEVIRYNNAHNIFSLATRRVVYEEFVYWIKDNIILSWIACRIVIVTVVCFHACICRNNRQTIWLTVRIVGRSYLHLTLRIIC